MKKGLGILFVSMIMLFSLCSCRSATIYRAEVVDAVEVTVKDEGKVVFELEKGTKQVLIYMVASKDTWARYDATKLVQYNNYFIVEDNVGNHIYSNSTFGYRIG